MLSWHVDYWDYLGWKDPFGSKAHTERQKRYVKALGLRGLVTPQLFAGNAPVAARALKEAVEKGAEAPALFALEVQAKLEETAVRASAKLTRAGDAATAGKGAGVFALLVRRSATTAPDAGENRGATLVEHFVVLAAGAVTPLEQALEKGVQAEFPGPAGAAAADLLVAFLVEEGESMKTLECAWAPVR